VLDEYGATNPAEFFAVATECFFEKSAQLRRKHPELYEELKEYYRQDPERAVTGGLARIIQTESNKEASGCV
jgi:Mlc titration factor MtfA (ptsG expression regulator)